MPGNPALPVVTNSYAFLLCMRGCGCVGTRHSPRPSMGKADNSCTPRTHSRRENADVCVAAEKWRRDVSAAVLPASNRFPPRHAVLLTQDESFRGTKNLLKPRFCRASESAFAGLEKQTKIPMYSIRY